MKLLNSTENIDESKFIKKIDMHYGTNSKYLVHILFCAVALYGMFFRAACGLIIL